ncbi:hypothetical protein [Streptomyces vinaceus]|uniref:hypothetical protein n=1 Tax=Streptomyces vinaceus TaxID=1960 RepID=UPI00104EA783|nr:hypothetical protein [Streptomyces vinaceus]GHE46170.1 hypothetical protein GCM10017778_32530 [Streptomyces vinaceus]
MASVQMFNAFIFNTITIPAGGAQGYWVGPSPALGSGTVTVTAHSQPGFVTGDMILGVELLKTRWPGAGGGQNPFIDITVRNHGTNSCPFVRLMVSTVQP